MSHDILQLTRPFDLFGKFDLHNESYTCENRNCIFLAGSQQNNCSRNTTDKAAKLGVKIFVCGLIMQRAKLLPFMCLCLFQPKSLGQVLFDAVVGKLQLLEYDYFDLEYLDTESVPVSTQCVICALLMVQWLLKLCFPHGLNCGNCRYLWIFYWEFTVVFDI